MLMLMLVLELVLELVLVLTYMKHHCQPFGRYLFWLDKTTVMLAVIRPHGGRLLSQGDRGDSDCVPVRRYSLGASWWTLSDNWEGTVLFWTLYYQVHIPLDL